MTIRCVGKKVTVTANGTIMCDGEFDIPEKGNFVFYTGMAWAGGDLTFRNLNVRELNKD
jgi:hypothetical protein